MVRTEAPRQPDRTTAVPLRDLLQTVRAYLLKEDFQQFWEYEQPSWAGKFLDEWCCQVMRSRIEPMKKIARILRSHRALILNYLRAREQFSSGVVEGLNVRHLVAEEHHLLEESWRCWRRAWAG